MPADRLLRLLQHGRSEASERPLVEAVLAAFTFFFWYLRGAFVYGKKAAKLALAAPLVTVVHAMGTVAGIYAPPKRSRVTTKVRRRVDDRGEPRITMPMRPLRRVPI